MDAKYLNDAYNLINDLVSFSTDKHKKAWATITKELNKLTAPAKAELLSVKICNSCNITNPTMENCFVCFSNKLTNRGQ